MDDILERISSRSNQSTHGFQLSSQELHKDPIKLGKRLLFPFSSNFTSLLPASARMCPVHRSAPIESVAMSKQRLPVMISKFPAT
jgi:hypothetical protein